MTFCLINKDKSKYIDPFTNKIAIFQDKKTAFLTSFMLFDQQNIELKVCEN